MRQEVVLARVRLGVQRQAIDTLEVIEPQVCQSAVHGLW